jgi:signal transduction histidine kinase/ligand-binding sensor domain-containing protein/AraC-like DNA-binding protein
MEVLIRKKYLIFIICIIFSGSVSFPNNVKFYNINSLYGISMRETNSVCTDDNGFIWVSSKTGILRITGDDYRIYQLPYETANIINVKLVYKNSHLIAFTNNGQLFNYNEISDRFEFLLNLSKELKNNFLSTNSVLVDDTNTYWIASSVGLYKYSNCQLLKMDSETASIRHATWMNNHQIIIAKRAGISIFDTQTLKSDFIYTSPTTLSVCKLFYDGSMNRLWVGTLSKGLFFFDFKTSVFSNVKIKSFPFQPILAIESVSDSSLLIGIDGQGIWEINKKGDHVLNIYKEDGDVPLSLRGNGVYDIYCDSKKRVWICTFSGGLSYFDPILPSPVVNQITHQINNANSLVNNDVNCVIEDTKGNIWFATNNGISCWEVKSDRWKNYYRNKQQRVLVFESLCEDDKGRIWAGSYSSGVYVLDGSTGKELAHYIGQENKPAVLNDFVFDIIKDSQGDIWIGGVNGIVACYHVKEDKFQQYGNQPLYTFAEFTPNQMLLGCTYGVAILDKKTGEVRVLKNGFLVHDILVMNGIIWIATGGDGLVRFDPGKDETEIFTTKIGLPSNFVTSLAYSDGFMWLGTESGLCRFNPEDKSVLTYSSINPLEHVSFNRNAHFRLKNGHLAWGTNNGAIIFDPKAIQQVHSKGKIFLQNLSIAGRSIREQPSFKLNMPLDSLKDLKLKYNQNTISLELLPLGVPSDSKLSWKMEGLDKDWSQPTSRHILTYANIPSKNLSLKIRLYNNSMSQLLSERTLRIKKTPQFWETGWFLLLVFLITSTIFYFIIIFYVNLIKQRHNEVKMRFFTNTAHDFRTSLTLIKGPIEELIKEKSISESGSYYLHLASEQVGHLTSAVTQMMDFQKVDIGKEQLIFAMTDVVGFVDTKILMFDFFAKGKNIKLIFNSNQPVYKTAIDRSLIEKVIENLISNAIKYSPLNSEVNVKLKCNKRRWILEVEDHGIGIGKMEQQHLFREFYRGENAINSKTVGSGIGLLLVKNYVLLHGGQVSCISEENAGSTFKISIPYKEIPGEKEAAVTAREDMATAEPADGIDSEPIILQENSSFKDMSILIVEDNEELADFLRYRLKEDFNVYSAEDGTVAWQIIQKNMPDLVISDVMMPNMDGFELCRLIKSTYQSSHIPVVLLTSLSGKAEQMNGLGLGADDYLTKPFDMELLQQKLKSIIHNREAIREKALKLIKRNSDLPILSNEHNDQFLKKILEVVRENISNPDFGKDEFASVMNISSSLLYQKIKSLTNQSPGEFVKSVRLNYALELLQTGKHTVTEISDICGYASIGYFSTVFKKHFGKSPSEVRNKNT